MNSTDLTTVVQEMMAQMNRMQAELTDLKTRANVIVSPEQPVRPAVSTTRRTTIKRLGLALMGGLATATALGQAPAVQAKIIVNPQGSLADKAGMVVLLPGVGTPTGTAPDHNYGLIASADITPFALSTLPNADTGVFGKGATYGVHGRGTIGVQGEGITGVQGEGDYGVKGQGTSYGVVGSGDGVGVYGFSTSGTGVKAESQSGAPLNIKPGGPPDFNNQVNGDFYLDANSGVLKYLYYGIWKEVSAV